MRAPNASDFEVLLEGVGKFVLGRMTYGDRLATRAKFLTMARAAGISPEASEAEKNGPDADEIDYMRWLLRNMAKYQTLVVSCPLGWQDPWAEEVVLMENITKRDEQLSLLFRKIGEAEDSFRR